MRVPASMRDAVSGIAGDHLVIGTNQLACWVLCDQPRSTRTRVARARCAANQIYSAAMKSNSAAVSSAAGDGGRTHT